MLIVFAFAVVWVVSLSRSLFDPIGFDQAFYQFVTDRVAAGQRMYVDVWDQNGPGIVAIHWLANRLVGRSPLALRVFDAGWQLLTFGALILLAGRDGKRWSVGWLAAVLYALAYYSMGYVHTAQREGFAVLPLLLAAHAVISVGAQRDSGIWCASRHFFGGVMCLFVFAIKPPLGLCFGVLWFQALVKGWRRRHEGPVAFSGFAGLSAGFVLSAVAGALLLIRLGWWSGFLGAMSRQEVPGHIRGPDLIRGLVPYAFPAVVLIAAIICFLMWQPGGQGGQRRKARLSWEWGEALAMSTAAFVVLLMLQHWRGWQQIFIHFIGVFLLAAGSILIRVWFGRSPIWRICLLLLCVSFAAIVLQGMFYLYHFPPVLAFAAYIAANEIVDRFRRFEEGSRAGRVWGCVCLAAVAHLAVNTWGQKMTFYTTSPYVLNDATLIEHYSRVTKHKPRFPTYGTTVRVAERVKELTAETEPIACLIDEPRLYYLSRRPPAHRLLRTQLIYRQIFPEFMQTIYEKRPKVLLARVPRDFRETKDLAVVQSAVFDDVESYFGPKGRVIRENYRLTEVIDDVCILQPIRMLADSPNNS